MLCVVPKMKLLRSKFLIFTFLVVIVYAYIFYLALRITPLGLDLSKVKLPYVVVHIDLKGAPMKLSYLESILPMLKKYGVNGLLMEYEDMFPYDGKLVNISAKDCYGKIELKHFLKTAFHLGFEIIPLIQTFGHMEHVLKLREFKHLREVKKYPDSICPSNLESQVLISDILEQVISFHHSVIPLKHIHVGCDEVFNLFKCQRCTNKKTDIIKLFTDHVGFVADAVTKLSPQTTILIWDDMLRDTLPTEFNAFSNVEPVYWSYSPDIQAFDKILFDYHNKFKNIWIASAFKGADGMVASLPLFKDRLSNHFSWMNFILNYKFGGEKTNYEFKGIILTGWSRYNHFEPLCELFPVALPSLIANLLLIDKFKKGFYNLDISNNFTLFYIKYISKELSQSLKCLENNQTDASVLGLDTDLKSCDFEGRNLYSLMIDYESLKGRVEEEFSNTDTNRYYAALEYYAKANFVSIFQQEKHLKFFEKALFDLFSIKNSLAVILKTYYSDNVIQEFINYKTYSLKTILTYHLNLLLSVSSIDVWERNPLNFTI